MFGNGVATYMVLPTTSGSPSCPRRTPVENDHATFRFFTLSPVIWLSELYRVDAGFLFGIVHSLSGPAAAKGEGLGEPDDAGALPVLQDAARPEATSTMTLNSLDATS